jgi:hypothetical protein
VSIIQTLDGRIRAAARNEVKEDLLEAVRAFKSAMDIIGTVNPVNTLHIGTLNEVKVYDKDVIEAIYQAAIERLSPKAEDKAVAAFLCKVESLQDQIEDLHSQVVSTY